MNALARAIFFGKHGELRDRALQDQLQRARALNIIIDYCMEYRISPENRKKQGKLQEELPHHISPLGWEQLISWANTNLNSGKIRP
ncbi:Tn3 family transposase [Paenibacillus elgii]|uniref:Tn3 family transposase n=1 Tax=Paenibacillus elgii TaxID=189691 RepID=UPI003F7E84B5